MQQLTSLDAQFLAMESARVSGHVSGLAIYDPSTAPGGEVTQEGICRLVAERLHLLPPFRYRLVPVPLGLDHPYWIEDPDFDLDFHVRETAVAPPGNDRQLAELVARIVARPLDRGRPLWELYIIHGLPKGRVGILTKIHHSVVDGVSGAEILTILLDVSPEGREVPPGRPPRAERVPSQLEMLGRGLSKLPAQPLRAAAAIPATIPNLGNIPGAELVPGLSTVDRQVRRVRRFFSGSRDRPILERSRLKVPRTRFNGEISAHRRFAFGSLPLDRVKAIKDELGITVNDAVVGLCATALRNWFAERDELPDDPLIAMVPVSVRTREQMGTFGNRVSAMFVPIPTDVADTRERLMKAHETLRGAKERHRAVPAELLQDVTQFIPPAVHARASRLTMQLGARYAPPINVVISNVPGPRMPLFIAGAKMEGHFPVSVITDGVGLNITCLSYLDHIDFGIVADHDMVDDAWPMMEAVEDALREIDELVCGRKPSRKAASRRKEAAPTA
jgi:diacylglycerol O-acyltransferase